MTGFVCGGAADEAFPRPLDVVRVVFNDEFLQPLLFCCTTFGTDLFFHSFELGLSKSKIGLAVELPASTFSFSNSFISLSFSSSIGVIPSSSDGSFVKYNV